MRVDALRRLNRDHLYMEVWLRPIGHIARDWDITSANLRAACKALGVTVPSVGHWAAIRAGDAPQPPALPISEDATTITAETRPRESLVEWMKRGDMPAAPKKERKVIAPLKTASTVQPRYVPLSVWATAVFGEFAPHNNTLLRWVHDGRIQPQPRKIGRLWWVKPDAEYIGD